MSTKKLLVGTLIAFVFIFLLDYLWYGVLMNDFFTRVPEVDREMPLFPWLILGTLIMAYAFCRLYLKGRTSDATVNAQGIQHGILVVLLVFVPMALIRYGVQSHAALSEYLIDLVFRVVQFIVLGIIIANYFGQIETRERPGKGAGGGD